MLHYQDEQGECGVRGEKGPPPIPAAPRLAGEPAALTRKRPPGLATCLTSEPWSPGQSCAQDSWEKPGGQHGEGA